MVVAADGKQWQGVRKTGFKEIVMTVDGRLKDKVAIITGAASGIGKATAILFAKEGARLALADVDAAGLKETADQIAKAGGTAVIKKTDVSKEGEVKALVAHALKAFSKVDIVCNIAGIAGDMVPLDQQDSDVDGKTGPRPGRDRQRLDLDRQGAYDYLGEYEGHDH